MDKTRKKVLIAMSGGVDSSVAVHLLQKQGFECVGVTFKLFDSVNAPDDIGDARKAAKRLEIEHFVKDYTGEFDERVIKSFVKAYQDGLTPNPCVVCNRQIKFKMLLSLADELGIYYAATGHYAGIEYHKDRDSYQLKKAVDLTKDQSYVLYTLTQDKLKRLIFPLYGLQKNETREIASGLNLVNAEKRDSQDICFVRDGDYSEFIRQYTGESYAGGDFIDTAGKILGKHTGLIHYTIGQRKGLGLALPAPMYVKSKNIENNQVTLCENHELFTNSLDAAEFNWIDPSIAKEDTIRAKARVRYSQKEKRAVVSNITQTTVHIEFEEPQRAITKGQAVVLYDQDTVLGGGTII